MTFFTNQFKLIKDDKKASGFYVNVLMSLLSILTSIVYVASYSMHEYFSIWVFVLFLLAGLVGVVLNFFRKYDIASYAMYLFSLLGTLFYINAVYYDVSVVLVGIDKTSFDPWFILSSIFILLTFILSIVNVFMKKTKKEECIVEEDK